MNGHPLLAGFEELRACAVVRTETPEQAAGAAEACLRAGLRLVEITLTVPRALEVVGRLASRPEAVVGAGTLLSPAQVRDAAAAGARFVVSPHFDPDVLAEAKSRGLLCAMGAVTPTECMACHRAGVDVIKIFPASAFGPGYVRALREPLPFLRLMPTGGVDAGNLREWLEAGAWAVGIGGSLVDRRTAAGGDWAAVEARARQVVDAVRAWQAGSRAS